MSDATGPTIMYLLPDATQCEIAADEAKSQSGFCTEFYRTLWLLLSAGFGILLTCSPVFGQFTVTERSEFTVTVRNHDETPPTPKRRWLAVFTASYCQPCQRWNRTQRQIVKDAGFFVREHDMGKAENKRLYGETIRRVPAYIVCDWETGEWVSDPIVGYTSAEVLIETIETAARSQDMAKESPASNDAHPVSVVRPFRNPSLFGSLGTSHESRSTLIRHLLNDGIHRGRWQIDTLNSMSDDALNQAHSDDHARN